MLDSSFLWYTQWYRQKVKIFISILESEAIISYNLPNLFYLKVNEASEKRNNRIFSLECKHLTATISINRNVVTFFIILKLRNHIRNIIPVPQEHNKKWHPDFQQNKKILGCLSSLSLCLGRFVHFTILDAFIEYSDQIF